MAALRRKADNWEFRANHRSHRDKPLNWAIPHEQGMPIQFGLMGKWDKCVRTPYYIWDERTDLSHAQMQRFFRYHVLREMPAFRHGFCLDADALS